MPKRLLDDNLKNQLVALMPRIIHDVEIVSSLDERDASADLELLLDDIAILSPKITHHRDDEAHPRRPSFSINRVGTSIGVSFAGIPMGHEFSSLVLALLQVGGNPIKESPEVIKAVEELDGDFEFITYMSLTCQNCPTVVQALNTMSVINPRIRHTAVEGSLFGEEIAEHNVLAVPTIWLNGKECVEQGFADKLADRCGGPRSCPAQREGSLRCPGRGSGSSRGIGRHLPGPQGTSHRSGR